MFMCGKGEVNQQGKMIISFEINVLNTRKKSGVYMEGVLDLSVMSILLDMTHKLVYNALFVVSWTTLYGFKTSGNRICLNNAVWHI